MNINTHSRIFTRTWHAQLATNYQFLTVRDLYDGMTLCEYASRVVWGMFVMAGVIAGVGVIAAVVGDFGAWLAAGVVAEFTEPGELARVMIAFLMLAGVIATAVGIFVLWFKFGRRVDSYGRPKPREPMLIERLWAQHRDKVCFQLTFDKEPQ